MGLREMRSANALQTSPIRHEDMSDFKIPVEKSAIAVNSKRDVNLTMPWFSQKSKYHPSAGNVVHPLINGERAFGAVHEAISAAKKSIDIISWGFDPSMRLVRPGGKRVGELLKEKAAAGVTVRVLIWKNALANLGENNVIGDGWAGSGGGSAGVGSGAGSTSAGNATGKAQEFNTYGSGKSGRGSAGVMQGDPGAKEFNRAWFAAKPANLSFRTRDFGRIERIQIEARHIGKHGLGGTAQRLALTEFTSHHQKMVLVDYEEPADAVGFVMGHNMLRDYWDTDAHEYYSEQRLGFGPWQDLSTRVYGPVLWDLNENFCTAWTKSQPWIGSDQPIPASRLSLKPEVFEAPAAKRGGGEMAQICRTQPQESDQSILDDYKLALSNARNYVYFENQYFRSTELAMQMREMRRKLKAKGWKRDFYVFVVTNTPDDKGRMTTYEAMHALGKSDRLPTIEKKKDGEEVNGDSASLRRADLDGMNIHVCTLRTSGQQYQEPQAVATGGVGAMGFPEVSVYMPEPKTVYKDIYVHSKLLLVDDVFFTIGSANANIRSMEVDSELNIAMPSPTVTQQWRKHLWKLHTGREPGDSPEEEFRQWRYVMDANEGLQRAGKPLQNSLIEFYDDGGPGLRAD
jgi:phosphatidylserine/phosphatidylglycerophosphate/cardiolipin synthase-like enzyme